MGNCKCAEKPKEEAVVDVLRYNTNTLLFEDLVDPVFCAQAVCRGYFSRNPLLDNIETLSDTYKNKLLTPQAYKTLTKVLCIKLLSDSPYAALTNLEDNSIYVGNVNKDWQH